MERYVLKTPAVAVVIERGARNVITVTRASIIEVPLPLNDRRGLIEVTLNGVTVLMFAEDIRERGELVGGTSAG